MHEARAFIMSHFASKTGRRQEGNSTVITQTILTPNLMVNQCESTLSGRPVEGPVLRSTEGISGDLLRSKSHLLGEGGSFQSRGFMAFK